MQTHYFYLLTTTVMTYQSLDDVFLLSMYFVKDLVLQTFFQAAFNQGHFFIKKQDSHNMITNELAIT